LSDPYQITLGIGTPSTIGRFITFGLTSQMSLGVLYATLPERHLRSATLNERHLRSADLPERKLRSATLEERP